MVKFLFSSYLLLTTSLSAIPMSPTNVCWSCIFPITVSGVTVGKESHSSKNIVCTCPGLPPKVGVPVSFWDPAYIVDVTADPGKFIALGFKKASTSGVRGSMAISGSDPCQRSFSHVHLYRYPILKILGFLVGSDCLGKLSDMDIAYVSELDPTWTDETLTALLHPEMNIYALPAAQMACLGDALGAEIEWCAGCQGSLFPLMGYVGHHASPLQASSLLVHRLLTRMHRTGTILDYPEGEFCTPRYNPFPRKSNYKLQLIHPVVERRSSHKLGQSDLFWGFGKSRGLDYSYIVWMKRQCCLDSVKFASTLSGVAL